MNHEIKEKYKEIIRYLIVGVLTTVVSLGVYYMCVSTFLTPKSAVQLQLANIFSWVAAVTFAYIMSRFFVFQSKRKNWIREALSFYSSRVLTLFMDMSIMFVMVTLCGLNDKLAKLVVQVVVTVVNYIFSKLFVFRNY
ncbi:GtrA family protein [Ventrimonas sp. CLA-AP-H27]|uniref:GtrA family protein n=1 Tax=Ventrimonas faecis TaxID=3133170 RepID=A0ABV1HNE5_9FIRM